MMMAKHCLTLQELSIDLDCMPRDIEDLKSILSTISQVKAESMDMEFRIKSVVESYRIVYYYNIQVTHLSFSQLVIILIPVIEAGSLNSC